MPKGLKNKICVYCNNQSSTVTGDHIIPRSFFLEKERANIPKVPACIKCNKEKSDLEHYLATVLPFGAKHLTARENLTKLVPKRLNKNAKLFKQLQAENTHINIKNTSGLIRSNMVLPFDGDRYTKFFEYVGMALLWHHWKLRVPEGHDIVSIALSKTGETFWRNLLNLESSRIANDSIGGGAFLSHGKCSDSEPLICVWIFSLYGGIDVSDPDSDQNAVSRYIGVMIAPSKHIQNLPYHNP